jgi:hypothetical protein
MNVRIISEVITLLDSAGYITPAGDFDAAKFNDISADLTLASGVEGILVKHGVAIPPRLDALLKMLPLLAGLFRV